MLYRSPTYRILAKAASISNPIFQGAKFGGGLPCKALRVPLRLHRLMQLSLGRDLHPDFRGGGQPIAPFDAIEPRSDRTDRGNASQ